MSWYSKYLAVYEKPFSNISEEIVSEVKDKLQDKQSDNPLASVTIIAYNEGNRLLSCLWSLSESVCKYPIEIIGVNNNSKDKTEDVFKAVELPYYNELNRSCGYARNCGLQNAKGRYHICIDGDTMYPPEYIEILINELQKPDVVAVSSLWSYIPDKQHSLLSIKMYEFFRNIYLRIQSIQRPELAVRGMVFGYVADLGKKVGGYRVNIKRGEDGAMALGLKDYGKIIFIRNKKAKAITGYGTLNIDGSFFNSFKKRVINKVINSKLLFTKQSVYLDEKDNIIQQEQ